MRLSVLFLLMLIILVSGCTEIEPMETGTGLVITDFAPEFPEVFSTEYVDFESRIQNTGSLLADYIQAEIVGIESWELVRYNDMDCNVGFSLVGADAQRGTEGETQFCSWTYEAPHVPLGLSTTYHPTLRVYYNYLSNTVNSVSIVPRNELRRLQNSGLPLPTDEKSSTAGPIKIEISTEPILSFGDSVTLPIKITVNNNNDGVACYTLDCKDTRNWNKVMLSFSLDETMNLIDCNDMVLSLYKGKSNTITCNIEALDIPDDSISKRNLQITAEYTYMIEKTADVAVLNKG